MSWSRVKKQGQTAEEDRCEVASYINARECHRACAGYSLVALWPWAVDHGTFSAVVWELPWKHYGNISVDARKNDIKNLNVSATRCSTLDTLLFN